MKQPFTDTQRIIITCNKRLAPCLEQEVLELGYDIVRTFQTGVELLGTMQDCIRLNMNLRCASQVLFSIKSFTCKSPDHLYRALESIAWENIIPVKGYFSVTSTVNHFTVNNEMFVNVKVKDAIVDRMRHKFGVRPDSGPMLDRTVIHLYWHEDNAEVFIDTSGETLAKHGYRKIPGKAPMLEALAAATVMTSRWDRQTPFVNPMCGSGTLAIEAAMLATNRRPGLYRSNYAFMHVEGYDATSYERELDILKAQVKPVADLKIIATDIQQDAIEISKINAGVAGVEELITFNVCDFAATEIPPAPGVVFLNPEYGERLGDITVLEETYSRIGDFMKKQCQGYLGYIFTGNMDLAKKIGLKAKRRIEFYNAKIDCRLLEYELYAGTRRKDVESPPEQPQ